MLQLSQALINQPVLSLRTGSPVATTLAPIINPNNLKIEGLYCQDRFKRMCSSSCSIKIFADVLPQGIVVDDHDVLSEPHELVRLKGRASAGLRADRQTGGNGQQSQSRQG